MAKKKAYSYMRFSSAPQEFGDSIRRQIEKRDKFLAETDLDLELDTTLDMTDRALSGFDGSNVKKGALGAFLKAIETGKVRKDSYLIVENLDRLSRQAIEESMYLLLGILRNGINIITLSDQKVIQAGNLSFPEMIPVLVELQRANAESERKSELIGAAWKGKKAAVLKSNDHKKLTKWCPKWLTLSEDRKSYEVNHERVELIERMLNWVTKGYGSSRIIQMLEDAGIPPWESNNGVKSDKRLPKRWHLSMIQRIVRSRELLGEYRMKLKDPNTGEVSYKTIINYYPNVLEGKEHLFYEAQEARTKRDKLNGEKRPSGNHGDTFSNLFAGIAVCGYSLDNNRVQYHCAGDNESMIYINKGPKSPIKYLQCGRLKSGNHGCEECSKMWRYDHFETAFLKHVNDIDVSEILGSNKELNEEVKNLETEILKKKDELSNLKEQESTLAKSMADLLAKGQVISNILNNQANLIEQRIQELPFEIRRLKSLLKTKTTERHNPEKIKNELSDLIEVMQSCEDEKELYGIRTHLSSLLGKVIDRIEVYAKGDFFNEQKLQKILEKFPEDMKKERDQLAKELRDKEAHLNEIDRRGRRHIGFFVVCYRSGETRIVRHHPLDPNVLTINAKFDGIRNENGFYNRTENFDERSLEKLYIESVTTKDKNAKNLIKDIFGDKKLVD